MIDLVQQERGAFSKNAPLSRRGGRGEVIGAIQPTLHTNIHDLYSIGDCVVFLLKWNGGIN